MKRKPWYIWLSLPAFVLLILDTGRRSVSYERKNKISVLDGKSVWFIFVGNAFALIFLLFIVPSFLFTTLFRLNETYWGIIGTTGAEVIDFIRVYLCGVYATYRHVQWRDKHMPHILKPKQSEDDQ